MHDLIIEGWLRLHHAELELGHSVGPHGEQPVWLALNSERRVTATIMEPGSIPWREGVVFAPRQDSLEHIGFGRSLELGQLLEE